MAETETETGNTTALEHLDRLLGELYQAPLQAPGEDTLWQGFLTTLRDLLQANFALMMLRPPSELGPGVILMDNVGHYTADFVYNNTLFTLDPFVNLPPDRAVTLADYLSDAELEQTEFYRLCMLPGKTHHVLGADLHPPQGFGASIRITRPREAAAFGDTERQWLQRLIPHLKRALTLHARLQRIESERRLYAHTLTSLSMATILVDAERRVLETNAVAERLLAEQDGLRLRGGVLELEQTQGNRELRELVQQAAQASEAGETLLVKAIPVARPSGKLPLGVVVRPVSAALGGQDNGPAAAIFISDPERPAPTSEELLGQLFGLTPAEARLALQLADGQSLEQAATALGITRNTGRAHLRSIFAKTGVTQQTQLVSLILKSAVSMDEQG